MKVICVIPARYGSTRFKGKVLANLWGKPIIQHVYERALRAKTVAETWVATDDKRVYERVRAFGGKVQMTSRRHRSGTDRIAEVARSMPADIIINVQGDEPLISPAIIDRLVLMFKQDKSCVMGSVCTRIQHHDELHNSNVVKVVMDTKNNALYFSRFPIPFFRDHHRIKNVIYYKHIGIYGFRRQGLYKLVGLPATPLEKSEKLEQLRALENGFRIRMIKVRYRGRGVDTRQDLEKLKENAKAVH
jgi:3-deoxy-manno-octulosonate cytidylyltransferase (CMP-KDO synthetase)